MDNLLNKAIIFFLCLGLMLLVGVTTQAIIGMLVAVSLTAIFELPQLPKWAQRICPLLYCLLTLFFPSFVLFLPLAAGDLFRLNPPWLRAAWIIPLLVLSAMLEHLSLEPFILIATLCFSSLGCLFSWRASRIAQQQEDAHKERDRLAQISYNLEMRNRDLLERQVLELELATLGERSRIARDIHDNVGHLLTRSILQTKALAVVHKGNAQLTDELEEVSSTLDTAFETVRKSVHDLYEESTSLQAQLEALATREEGIAVTLEYRSEDVPPKISASIMAIVREALSNTQRHSNATSVQISVVEFPGLYQLIVHDNGSLEPSAVAEEQTEGLGLMSMEERARSLGGIFRTSFDRGFKVFVSLPKEETEQRCAL